MKQTKKLLALLLCLGMVAGLAACGGGTQGTSDSPAPESTAPAGETTPADTEEPAGEAATDPDSIDDNMTSADGTYQVAFVTDVGQLKDKSFNQGTYDGVKLYAYNNGLSYKYYQPANGNEATDDDRVNAMQAAVDAGAKVVVCAGFLQEAALRTAAINNPDVNFVFIDGYRPIFAEKFKTENHPLFDKLGIDDPGHPHYKNNSDVVQDFAALAAKHQREYEQQMAASRSRSNLPIQPQTESKAGGEEEGGRKDSMMRELSAEEFERSIGLDDLAQEKPGGEAEIKGEMEKELEADTSLLAALKNRNRRNQEVS